MQEAITTDAVAIEPPKLRVSVLEAAALRAALWTFLSYGAGQGLRVANSLILTRLLMPSAFGEMALVTTLIVGMTLLSDIGLGRERDSKQARRRPRVPKYSMDATSRTRLCVVVHFSRVGLSSGSVLPRSHAHQAVSNPGPKAPS